MEVTTHLGHSSWQHYMNTQGTLGIKPMFPTEDSLCQRQCQRSLWMFLQREKNEELCMWPAVSGEVQCKLQTYHPSMYCTYTKQWTNCKPPWTREKQSTGGDRSWSPPSVCGEVSGFKLTIYRECFSISVLICSMIVRSINTVSPKPGLLIVPT